MELAAALAETGNQEHADLLVNTIVHENYATETNGFNAEYYSALGDLVKSDDESAMKLLKEAVLNGFRSRNLLADARLDRLRDQPEFIAMMELVETDMTIQLAEIKRLDAEELFSPVPLPQSGK